MTIKEQLQKDLVTAMKAKDNTAVTTIRSMITELSNNEKVKGKSRTEIDVLKTLHKQRVQAFEEYSKAGEKERADQEMAEALVIEQYLPKQLSETEINSYVKGIVEEFDEVSMKQMGMIIKKFNELYPGQDGKQVSQVVRSFLN